MTTQTEPQEMETMLPAYYQRLFPFQLFYKWLSYAEIDKNYFTNREFSFTLQGDTYIRYESFSNAEEFKSRIKTKIPVKIDIGAVYSARPKDHKTMIGFQPMEKELVFDIDMTDYDDVRFCCTGADICPKCWPLMVVAVKILDDALREDFGFEHILWVYSGRRGIHCWVCDETARKLSKNVRHSVVDYLSLLMGGDRQVKKVNLAFPIHPSIRRALDVLKPYFESFAIENQDFLGDQEKCENVLALIKDEKLRADVRNDFKHCSNTAERWEVLRNRVSSLNAKAFKSKRNHSVEEIMIQYCYPRLDAHVTIGLNHLLKSPFCVHPKTGRVCVPFMANQIDSFDPFAVPTLNQLIEEIDETNKNVEPDESQEKKQKDYKKTSLNHYINIFKSFIASILSDLHGKKLDQSDEKMEF